MTNRQPSPFERVSARESMAQQMVAREAETNKLAQKRLGAHSKRRWLTSEPGVLCIPTTARVCKRATSRNNCVLMFAAWLSLGAIHRAPRESIKERAIGLVGLATFHHTELCNYRKAPLPSLANKLTLELEHENCWAKWNSLVATRGTNCESKLMNEFGSQRKTFGLLRRVSHRQNSILGTSW